MRNLIMKNIFRASRNIAHRSTLLKSNFSTSSIGQQQPQFNFCKQRGSEIADVKNEKSSLAVTFEDSSKGFLPLPWLRDNCQCSACFDSVALGRNYLLQNLNVNVKPKYILHDGNSLTVSWNDDHQSSFDSKWLYQRAFNSQARINYRNFYRLQMEPWGKDVTIDTFHYNDIKKNDKELLKWLLTMERKGVALIRRAPDDPDAGPQLIDYIGFVKKSHYGRRSPVIIRENSNNVAFTNIKLGLHNDLTQYYHQPGMIFIHTVEQHRGSGGESIVSDGLLTTEILRKENPKAFEMLTKTNVYFWDKGVANCEMETDEFYKINKAPIIGLNTEGTLETMRVNNQVRDSHLDLPPDQINLFYEAIKLLEDTLQENSYKFKMEDGDILTLDNVRCLHGREGFEKSSSRHLESSYLDWDEALCRRRRLLEKIDYE